MARTGFAIVVALKEAPLSLLILSALNLVGALSMAAAIAEIQSVCV